MSQKKNDGVIKLDEGQIRDIAFEISNQGKSWDDLNWILGELEVKLSKSFTSAKNPLIGTLPKEVRLNPNLITASPSQAQIKKAAKAIADQNMSPEQLHWLIAIRKYLLKNLK